MQPRTFLFWACGLVACGGGSGEEPQTTSSSHPMLTMRPQPLSSTGKEINYLLGNGLQGNPYKEERSPEGPTTNHGMGGSLPLQGTSNAGNTFQGLSWYNLLIYAQKSSQQEAEVRSWLSSFESVLQIDLSQNAFDQNAELEQVHLEQLVGTKGLFHEARVELFLQENWSIEDKDWEAVLSMPHLVSLDLSGTGVTDAWFVQLVSTPRDELRTVILKDCLHVTDEGVQALKGLEKLERLELKSFLFTDAAMKYAYHWPDLKELSLEGWAFTEEALRNGDVWKQLEKLKLNSLTLKQIRSRYELPRYWPQLGRG